MVRPEGRATEPGQKSLCLALEGRSPLPTPRGVRGPAAGSVVPFDGDGQTGSHNAARLTMHTIAGLPSGVARRRWSMTVIIQAMGGFGGEGLAIAIPPALPSSSWVDEHMSELGCS